MSDYLFSPLAGVRAPTWYLTGSRSPLSSVSFNQAPYRLRDIEYVPNPEVWGHTGKDTSMSDIGYLLHGALAARASEKEQAAALAAADEIGEDTHPDGTVLTFTKPAPRCECPGCLPMPTFYVAVRNAGSWSYAGSREYDRNTTWDRLRTFMVSGGYADLVITHPV
jgi:hypothetical protein